MRALFTALLAAIFTASAEPQKPSAEQGEIAPTGKFEPAQQTSGLPADPRIGGRFIFTEVSPTQVKVGDVLIDREAKSLSFPVEIAVREQLLEYLLVHEMGKTHESLLSTKVQPQELHIAALFLNVVGQNPTLTLSWQKNGPDASVPLSDLISTSDESPHLSDGTWRYQGSQYDSRGLVAQREGSFITVIDDPSALLSHSLAKGLGRDDVYQPIVKRLPPQGTLLTLTLSFAR